MSSTRTVSITGVNGWCSANSRSPAGIDPVGTKPLPMNGMQRQQASRGRPPGGAGLRAEAHEQCDGDDEGHGEHGLDQAQF
jgi:hypothetical protein